MYILNDAARWVRKDGGFHIKVKYTRDGCLCNAPAVKSGADMRSVQRARICNICFKAAVTMHLIARDIV